MNPEYEAADFQKLLDAMADVGILEYDYGDNYNDDGPIPNAPKIKRWRLCFFVPGSAELMNSTQSRILKNPAVTSFFERMTFIPLAGVDHILIIRRLIQKRLQADFRVDSLVPSGHSQAYFFHFPIGPVA